MFNSILSIENLSIDFKIQEKIYRAVDNISFILHKEERLGVVGESGCGKSITCKAILGLLSNKAVISGNIIFNNENLIKLKDKQLNKVRGSKISMIFQEPVASLNPVFTIGYQLNEAILLHQKVNKKEAHEIALEMLNLVKLPQAEQRIKQYPFELSGGMCQRVMIAIALSCKPMILIADEPTTALDVTIQAQILNLIKRLNSELKTSLILITHDLGVIAETVENVIVMYAGNIVEKAEVNQLFHNPLHPYTIGLLAAIPKIEKESKTLEQIPGLVPSILNMPNGCRFNTRCKLKMELCKTKSPPEIVIDGHMVKCWKYAGAY